MVWITGNILTKTKYRIIQSFVKWKTLKTVVPQVRKQVMVLNNSAFLILFFIGAINSRKQYFQVVKIHSVNNSLFLFKSFDENLGKMSF